MNGSSKPQPSPKAAVELLLPLLSEPLMTTSLPSRHCWAQRDLHGAQSNREYICDTRWRACKALYASAVTLLLPEASVFASRWIPRVLPLCNILQKRAQAQQAPVGCQGRPAPGPAPSLSSSCVTPCSARRGRGTPYRSRGSLIRTFLQGQRKLLVASLLEKAWTGATLWATLCVEANVAWSLTACPAEGGAEQGRHGRELQILTPHLQCQHPHRLLALSMTPKSMTGAPDPNPHLKQLSSCGCCCRQHPHCRPPRPLDIAEEVEA